MNQKQIFLLFFGDIFSIIGSFWVVLEIRSNIVGKNIPLEKFLLPFFILLIIWLIILFIFNFYEKDYINTTPKNIGILAIAWIINIILGGLIFYLFPKLEIAPKITLLLIGIIAFFFLSVWRRIFYKIFSLILVQKIIVIGKKEPTIEFINETNKNKLLGKILASYEYINENNIEDMQNFKPDIIVAETDEIEKLIQVSRKLNSKILSIEQAYETLFAKIPLSQMNTSSAMQLATNRISFANWLFNKIFDRIIAFLILIISSPILLLAIVAIIIQDGRPVFLSQKRVGKNNKIFNIYKLRSMKVLASDGSAEKTNIQWAEKKDPRITKVGHIIRKLHVDEIPQMWNILRGDLALIGPRPERPEFVEKLEKEIPYYFLRHTIRPGFTGWAQIKFRYARNIDDSKEKFEYDLYYLKNRGLVFDIGIILKTIQIIFTH